MLVTAFLLPDMKKNKKTYIKSTEDSTDPYSSFASFYDYLLRHVDYQSWYEYIRTIMYNYAGNPNFIVEIGCGTGKFGAKFSNDGHFIIGIDKALNMLRVAKTRAYKNFRIVAADMQNFYLKQQPDFVFCVHDTMNYLLSADAVRKFFLHMKDILKKESVFLFDITTEFNVCSNFNQNESTYNHYGHEIVWNNYYDTEDKIVHSVLKFKKDDSYLVEEHLQRIYSIEEIKQVLYETGYEILDVFGDYTMLQPHDETVMVNFIVKLSA